MASDPLSTTASGVWYPTRSNRSVDALLKRQGQQLCVLDAQGKVLTRAPIGGVNISSRIGSIARSITFPDESLFESFDNDAIDKIIGLLGHKKSTLIAGLEQFRPRLFGFAVLALMLIYVLYRLALPVAVEIAVVMTPKAVPSALGQSTLLSMDNTMLSQSKIAPRTQKSILKDFKKLASYSSRGENGFALKFRKAPSTIGPNAFALPDGTIIITDALVDMAGKDREMILGVLAHEIGHVEKQHSLRQMYRAAGFAGMLMFLTGDLGEIIEHILLEGNVLLALSYSREAEAEADDFGVRLMHQAGYNPLALARFFGKLYQKYPDEADEKKQDQLESVFQTHPGSVERVKNIQDRAHTLSPLPLSRKPRHSW